MATKLLHERLRDHAAASPGKKDLRINGKNHSELLKNEAFDLADEIERYYIPRPRFEDGEPVLKGCEVEGGVAHTVCVSDTGFEVIDADGNYLADLPSGEMVKRPSKVLDADGAPIEADDIVYRLGDPRRLKVADPHYAKFDNYCIVECVVLDDGRHPGDYPDADAVTYEASKLTHKEPNSLEKLLERMEDYAQKNEGYIDGSKVGDFSKELRAIMEGGA